MDKRQISQLADQVTISQIHVKSHLCRKYKCKTRIKSFFKKSRSTAIGIYLSSNTWLPKKKWTNVNIAIPFMKESGPVINPPIKLKIYFKKIVRNCNRPESYYLTWTAQSQTQDQSTWSRNRHTDQKCAWPVFIESLSRLLNRWHWTQTWTKMTPTEPH